MQIREFDYLARKQNTEHVQSMWLKSLGPYKRGCLDQQSLSLSETNAGLMLVLFAALAVCPTPEPQRNCQLARQQGLRLLILAH